METNEFLDLFYQEMDFYNEFKREDINPEMSLFEFSNWDSLSRATVYNFVQHELNVTLSHADLRECKTIQDIINLIGL